MIPLLIGIVAILIVYLLLRPKPSTSSELANKEQEQKKLHPDELALRSRLKLNGNGPKVSISVPKEIPSNLCAVISKISSFSNVFVIHESKEASASSDLVDSLPSEFKHHRILLHASRVGKIAILRQLKPDLHVEFDLDIANAVFPHLISVVYYGICFSVPEVKIPVARRLQSLDDVLKVEL